jgi:4-hydroxy-tetrahydrodipicolinate reductase
MIRLAISGAAGKMGGRIIALAQAADGLQVRAAIERAGHAALGKDAGTVAGVGDIGVVIRDEITGEFDALIDFASPDATLRCLGACRASRKPIVIGTTGHSTDQLLAIEEAGAVIPVLKAANMSLGVNLLFKLAAEVAAALGDDYDIEIVESHHRFKVDAPSGTALALRDAVVNATGRDAQADVIYGREGQTGQRPARQIGMHALRVGDTVGEHEVHFGNLGETIVLRHSAHTRDTFARGALRAVEWIVRQPPGLYSMQHVLGL